MVKEVLQDEINDWKTAVKRIKELFWFPGVLIFGCVMGWVAIGIFFSRFLK